MKVRQTDCETCNRVKLKAGKDWPVQEATVLNVMPSREFSYEVRLDNGDVVFCRPDHIVDIIPCPVEVAEELGAVSVQQWLKNT